MFGVRVVDHQWMVEARGCMCWRGWLEWWTTNGWRKKGAFVLGEVADHKWTEEARGRGWWTTNGRRRQGGHWYKDGGELAMIDIPLLSSHGS